jgi:hypothetical protein
VRAPVNALDFIETLEKRILRHLWEAVLVWSASVRALAQWEDEHLLEGLNPEALEEHLRMVDRQIALGEFVSLATEHPDFPDNRPASRLRPRCRFYKTRFRFGTARCAPKRLTQFWRRCSLSLELER